MKIDVKKLAKLANLKIKPEDEKKFEKQLSEIVTYFEKLNKVDTKDVEITSQVTGLENIMREDNPAPSLTQKGVLSGSDSRHNGLFRVDAILNSE